MDLFAIRLFLLAFIFNLPVIFSKNPQPYHHDLVNSLLKDYNRHLIPKNYLNQTVEVAAGLAMIHMDHLSETGVLSATAWMRLVWNDLRLQWDEDDFGGASVFRIDPSKIWLPDLEVYNTADVSGYSLSPQLSTGTNALVYPDGEVLYIPPVSLKVYCHNFTHSNWPQGEQDCNVKLGSWTYDGLALSLQLYNNKDEIDLKDMAPASPWVITHQLNGTRNKKFIEGDKRPYYDLDFRFKLKPQYTMTDPTEVPRLLYHLLIVTITTLVVLLASVCFAAWLNAKGKLVPNDINKM